MPSYQNYSNTSWERTVHTTLVNHMREEEIESFRSYLWLSVLGAKGRVLKNAPRISVRNEFGESGAGFDWPVRYRNHDVEANNGETPRNFARKNLWQTAQLEYRGYQATDQMYKKEFLENRGPEAVVRVFDKMADRLKESMQEKLATQFYIDGSATGNENCWHGLESMFACTGTVNATTGATRAANAADIVGYPDDTYAGLTTELADYGGSNSSGDVWPNGNADAGFDFWSPLVVNYTTTHADLPGATNTWAGQGDEAMRYAIIHSQRNASMNGQIDLVILARDMYFKLLNLIDDKERIVITTTQELRAMGFKNVFNFDGVDITWDTGVSAGVGYGLNLQNIELRCLTDDLYDVEGPDYLIDDQSWRVVVSTLSNLRFQSPRNFFALKALA